MTKLDWKKDLKALYNPPLKPVLVEVPPLNYLMIDGHGDPNHSPDYQKAIEALFSLAYTLKFAIKKAGGAEYAVYPAEGLWWTPDMRDFSTSNKSDWDWTMMIAQPEPVTEAWVDLARAEVLKKKALNNLDRVRFETFEEGPCAQVMYIGPYADEGPTIAGLHEFICEQGGELSGKHHEIYISDFRRTAPDKLKTVIRQPYKRIGA